MPVLDGSFGRALESEMMLLVNVDQENKGW